jgi:hypothetical protein
VLQVCVHVLARQTSTIMIRLVRNSKFLVPMLTAGPTGMLAIVGCSRREVT